MLMVPTKRVTGPWWVQCLGAWAILHLLCALLYAPAALKYSVVWLIVYGTAYGCTGGGRDRVSNNDTSEEAD